MRPLLIPFLLVLETVGARGVLAQPAPFPMSPSKADTPLTAPAAPAPAKTPANGVAPFQIAPSASSPAAHTPVAVTPAPPLVAKAAPARGIRNERPILPAESIRFEGETDSRSWTFDLTHEEALSITGFNIGYQNAVVVMPEASRLRVSINGESVIDTPIASSQDVRRISMQLRPGLLQPGQNVVRMEAIQRHRTDCSIAATYELWTDVDSASTKLVFADGSTRNFRSLDDLPAVGVDTKGKTTIKVVAPKLYRPEIRDRLLYLVQLIALRGRYAHPIIQVAESDSEPTPFGTVKVVMGLASELQGLLPVPDAATQQPLAILAQEQGSIGPTMVVSGPTWSDLDRALDIVASPIISTASLDRGTIDTASWHWPDIPSVSGRRSIRFTELGIATQEFTGRRLKAHFAVNFPADFYATEYGEVTLQLDTAYTSAVRPGSHIDIYVNGKPSAASTITVQENSVRRHAIRIPMKNFKSGINQVLIEAVLLTDADDRCAPGETLSETKRFVLLDTSTFDVPNFGRIGRLPDLGALSAGSYPYGDKPASVIMARLDPMHYAASGTLLAAMARSAGLPIRAQFDTPPSGGNGAVLFLGSVDELPQGLLSRVNVTDKLRILWPPVQPSGDKPAQQVANAEFSLPTSQVLLERNDAASTADIRKRWRDTLERRGIIQQTIGKMTDWIEENFKLSAMNLPFETRPEAPYEPSPRSNLLMAQNRTEGTSTWTLVTARTEDTLAEGVARLTDPLVWAQVSGRVFAIGGGDQPVEMQPVSDYRLIQTQPVSPLNVRLVIANWMSINIFQYALIILGFCALLGGATYLLLNRIGRRT